MNDKVTQEQFDEMDGIIVHLLIDNKHPPRALCSGDVIDPNRWIDHPGKIRKQCQACFRAAQRHLQERK